jgi:hypothetical protein
MTVLITRWMWWGAAAASALAIGGCAGSSTTDSSSAPASPLTTRIEAFFHALSIQAVQCPAGQGRRSCQVEFTDNYGQWWATIQVAGSRVISDPGGVADWLCASSCANPPGMTANTGNPKANPGSSASANIYRGQTGVTGIGGVVKNPGAVKPPKPSKVTGSSGVVQGTGSGVVQPTGSTGVVYGTGSTGAPKGAGSTGPAGETGATGVVYGTGSTGAHKGAGSTGPAGETGATGVVYGTGSTGPGG